MSDSKKHAPRDVVNSVDNRDIKTIRIVLRPDEFQQLKDYAEAEGFSMSQIVREAFKHEVSAIVNHLKPIITSGSKGQGLKTESTAICFTEQSYDRLMEVIAELNSQGIKAKKSTIINAVITDALKNHLNPPAKRGRPPVNKEPELVFRKSGKKTKITFKVRRYYRPGIETTKAISALSKSLDMPLSELYCKSLTKWDFVVIPEPPLIATQLVLVALSEDYKDLLDKLVSEVDNHKFSSLNIAKASWYSDSEKELVLEQNDRFLRNKSTGKRYVGMSDVLRSAIYNELDRSQAENLVVPGDDIEPS